jgi:hypothetical protein
MGLDSETVRELSPRCGLTDPRCFVTGISTMMKRRARKACGRFPELIVLHMKVEPGGFSL